MEKLTQSESNPVEIVSPLEKNGLTKKVLARLALWGILSVGPVLNSESQADEVVDKDVKKESVEVKPNFSVSAKAVAFEEMIKKSGLLSQEKNNKPTVVIITKEGLNERYGVKSQTEDLDSVRVSNHLTVSLVQDKKFSVVNRDMWAVKKLIEEIKFEKSGLVDPEQQKQLGKWIPADYYIVPSFRTEDGKQILDNEIINVNDGKTSVVSIEISNGDIELITDELASKTEKAIEIMETNK